LEVVHEVGRSQLEVHSGKKGGAKQSRVLALAFNEVANKNRL
jgi:hypothetical protein